MTPVNYQPVDVLVIGAGNAAANAALTAHEAGCTVAMLETAPESARGGNSAFTGGAFRFIADSPPDRFVARALELPEVQLFWQFARFPVIRTSVDADERIVDFGENRFVNTRRKSPQPFTYRVVFDSAGNVVEEGWQSDGMFLRRMQKLAPQRNGETP